MCVRVRGLDVHVHEGIYMLQCVAVCCSVLQCVAVCCSVLQCVAVFMSVYTYANRHRYESAQEWTNRTLAVHERTSVHFLVLPGSLLSITEIT